MIVNPEDISDPEVRNWFEEKQLKQFKEIPLVVLPSKLPLLVEIDTTTLCNLRCIHCHQSDRPPDAFTHISLNSIRSIVNDLKDNEFQSYESRIIFCGDGDFFSHPEWTQILDVCSKINTSICIYTNALQLTDEDIDYVCSLNCINLIHISIDAATEATYTKVRRGGNWNNLVRNLTRFCSSEKFVRMSMVVMSDTYQEISGFCKFAVQVKANEVCFQKLHDRTSRGWDIDAALNFDQTDFYESIRSNLDYTHKNKVYISLDRFDDIPSDIKKDMNSKNLSYPVSWKVDKLLAQMNKFVGEPLCLLPWVNIHIDVQGQYRVCCMQDFNSGQKFNSLQSFLTSKHLASMQRSFKEGTIPPPCKAEYCPIVRANRPDFDIVVTTFNNAEWVKPFLLSLNNTLSDIAKKIYIVDGSDDERHEEIKQAIAEFDFLNIKLIRCNERGHPKSILHALKTLKLTEYVCICDIDIVFLKKNWDVYITDKIQQGYTMISSNPRSTYFAELHFLVARKDIVSESELAHVDFIEDWDEDILPMPIPPLGEHAAITYLDAQADGKFLGLNQSLHFNSRWGTIVLNDDEQEFLYHNFYSARTKDNSAHYVPDEEFQHHHHRILCAPKNSKSILLFIQNRLTDLHKFISQIEEETNKETVLIIGDDPLALYLYEYFTISKKNRLFYVKSSEGDLPISTFTYLIDNGNMDINRILYTIPSETELVFVSDKIREYDSILKKHDVISVQLPVIYGHEDQASYVNKFFYQSVISDEISVSDDDIEEAITHIEDACRGIIMAMYYGQKNKIYYLRDTVCSPKTVQNIITNMEGMPRSDILTHHNCSKLPQYSQPDNIPIEQVPGWESGWSYNHRIEQTRQFYRKYSPDKVTLITEFFEQYSGDNYFSSGNNTESIDGTGNIASMNEDHSRYVRDYLQWKIPQIYPSKETINVLDVGAGQGFLQEEFNRFSYFNSFSVEGSSQIKFACDIQKMCVGDIASPAWRTTNLFKAFDLTTSIEFFEHIPRKQLFEVITNLKWLGDYHFCVINTTPPEDDVHHCTIMPTKEWLYLFHKNNCHATTLGHCPRSIDKHEEFRTYVEPLYELEPNPNEGKEAVFHNSTILLIDLRGRK